MSTTHRPYDTEQITSRTKVSSSNNIRFFEEIDSTNSWLIENGICGDICISEKQTSGRGSRGNNWVSPANGSIYLSICHCLSSDIKYRSLLGLVTGIAIAEALKNIGLKGHGVKWPNDIYWQRKKLGGILIETSNASDKFIIGVGLNIIPPEIGNTDINQQITSVKDAMQGKSFTRDELLIKIIDRLFELLKSFESLNFEDFTQRWRNWDILHGERVNFQHQGNVVSGTVTGIDQHGRLGISNPMGDTLFYTTADIKLDKKSIQQ